MYFRRLIPTHKAHTNTALNLQVDVGKEGFRNAKNPDLFSKKTVVTKIATGLNVIKPGCKSWCR